MQLDEKVQNMFYFFLEFNCVVNHNNVFNVMVIAIEILLKIVQQLTVMIRMVSEKRRSLHYTSKAIFK